MPIRPPLPDRPGPRRYPAAFGGFSLVELLVAMAVLGMLVMILAHVAQSVSDLWVSTQKRTNRQQSARAIIDFITRDLQTALPPIISSSIDSLQLIRNPSTLDAAYKSGHTLFWQAPIATDSTQGDIAVVGYFIRWTGNKSALCRLFVNPNSSNYLIGSPPPNSDWITDKIINEEAPADKQSGYLGLMAENVVGFWAEPLDAYGQEIEPLKDFDSRLGYSDFKSKKFPPGSLPPTIRISIALLDARSAARLDSSLQTLANQSKNAESFVKAVLAKPELKGIYAGLRAHSTSITLVNSR